MTNKKTKNLAVSIHNKLLHISRDKGIPFNLIFTRYLQERFLYRLSLSPYKDSFVLKGGFMLVYIDIPAFRPTIDVDFAVRNISNTTENIVKIFQEIISIQQEREDAVIFDAASVTAERIMEEGDYSGVRVKIKALMGTSVTPLTFDIAFGDIITPSARTLPLPFILAGQSPLMLLYPLESVIAEKFEAMVKLSFINSRMKDFYDVYSILYKFDIKEDTLKEAIQNTFKQRGTPLQQNPDIFSAEFAKEKQKLWELFLENNELQDSVPNNIKDVLLFIKKKIKPLL
jgi:predicted nucleotidyltransferase component of viral defense system